MTKSQRKKFNRAKNIRKKTNAQRNQKQKFAGATFEDIVNQLMNASGLHENEFNEHDCILCGSKVKSIHDSHNPYPLAGINIMLHTAKNENGKEAPVRCCSKCNKNKVIPARISSLFTKVA